MFDPLEAMVESWGADTAARFFGRCCPLLLDVGAVAFNDPATLQLVLEECVAVAFEEGVADSGYRVILNTGEGTLREVRLVGSLDLKLEP